MSASYRVERLPRTFEEAFQSSHDYLIDKLATETGLLSELEDKGLLVHREVEECQDKNMQVIMTQHKEPSLTKRGLFNKYRSFWFVLLSDPNIDRVDTNTRQKHKDKFHKKKILLEKHNKDPEYFRQIIISSYPLLAGGEFSLWQVRECKTKLEPLPADVNNAGALCGYEGIKRSCVYIRPQLCSVNKTDQLVSSMECELPLKLHTGIQAESHGPFMLLPSVGSWTSNTEMTMVPADDSLSTRPAELMMSEVFSGNSGSIMPNYPSMDVADVSAPVQLSNLLPPASSFESHSTAKRKDVSIHDSFKQPRISSSDDADNEDVQAYIEDMRNAVNDHQASQHAEKNDYHCDEDIVKCFICKQLLVEPMLLPCLDSFCLQCLEGLVQRTSQPYLCPICEARFEIPPGGVASLPHSSFAEKLVELTKIANKDGSNACCEVCIEKVTIGDDISRAVGYCLQCRQKLCSGCMETHKFMRCSRTHNVVDLGYKTAEEIMKFMKMEALHCSQHKSVLAVSHCHTCNVQICQDCLSHHTDSDHELGDVTNSTVRKNIEHCMQELSASIDKRQSVYAKYEHILEEAKQSIQSDLSKLEKYKSQLNNMARIVKFGNELVEKGSITDMLCHSKMLPNQIHKFDVNLDELLLSFHTSASKPDNGNCAIPNGHNEDTNNDIPDERVPGYDDESCECCIEKLKTITIKEHPCGVTCLFGNVYFIHKSSDVISVHQENDYSYLCDIPVSGLKSASDIVSCEKNSCLYVADEVNECIWQVSVSNNNMVDRLPCSISGPYMLSVTSDGCLLMVNDEKHCMDLYQPADGSLQQIQLPEYMNLLTHAVETADHNYIISFCSYDNLCCVSLVTNSGEVLHSYGSSCSTERGHLCSPKYLSLDPVGNLLVYDSELHLLLLLDSQLQLQCTRKCKSWRGMCYSKLTGHLITVHTYRQQCQVWKASQSQQVSNMESCCTQELSERNVFNRSYFYDYDDRQVSGVVYLMNRIFVIENIENEASAIEIYRPYFPFTRTNIISVSKLKAPEDMAACSKSNCLYVVDGKNCCVWKVKYDQTVRKLIKNIRLPSKLSVTSGRQLLIVNGLYGRLELYHNSGEVDRHVLLPDHIIEPHHAVMSLKHTIIVSYGCRDKDHGVCELSLVGMVLNTYSGSVKCPVYLSLDTDGQVFVADTQNERVLVLDSQLKLKRKLLTMEYSPFRVCVVDDVPVMITAGQTESSEVHLYSIGKPRLMISTTTDCVWDDPFDHLMYDDDTGSETTDDNETESDDHSDDSDGLDIFVNCKCLRLHTLNTLTRPTAVTCMFGLLYIACKNSDIIHVACCGLECSILEPITVNGLKSACDIVSCENKSCLYVSDEDNKCIWQVSVSNNNMVDRLPCSISDPYTLSVTLVGHLLMVNKTEHCLELYLLVDNKSQQIQLPEYMDDLTHAVETYDGNYIVASGGLHLVTSEGVELKSFCHQPGIVICSVDYMSLDADGNVFAFSSKHECVLLIDSALTHVTECHTVVARRFCVTDKSRQMCFVVGSQLEIYSLCSNSPMTSQYDGAVSVNPVNRDMCTTSGKDDSPDGGLTFLASVTGMHKVKLSGVAVLEGRIVVLTTGTIYIYADNYPFWNLEKITKEGLNSFECIAACDTRKCLYVTDIGSKCLYRIKPDHSANLEMFIRNIKPPYRMSVTPDGQILVINGHYHRLDLYEHTGSLCRFVLLPDSIMRPQHVVMSSSGTFIVAYGQQDPIDDDSDDDDDDDDDVIVRHLCPYQNHNDYKHGICELSLDGHLQSTYHGEVSCPQHMSVSSSGELFVADCGNKRVLLLDTQLKLKHKVEIGRARPTAVCYVPLHNRLLVNCCTRLCDGHSVLMFTATSAISALSVTVQQPHPVNAVWNTFESLTLPPSTKLYFFGDNLLTSAHQWHNYSKPLFIPTDASWKKTRARFLELKVIEAFPLLNGSELLIPGYDNLIIDAIEPDGNCFFRALSKEVTGIERYHDKIRCSVVDFMADTRFSSVFANYAGVSNIESYIIQNRVRYLGTWATEVEIFAAASLLRTTIVVYYQDRWLPFRPLVEVPEAPPSTNCCIYLTNSGKHFNRILVSTFQASHGVDMSIQM